LASPSTDADALREYEDAGKKQFKQWRGKIVVDLTNAFHVSEESGGVLSSELVRKSATGNR